MFSERMNNKGNHQGYNNDNSWSGPNVRKSYDYYNQNNRGGDYQQQHDGGNKIEQRMQNLRFDNGSSGKANNAEQHNKEPKKMTWATIASQPAKPQVNTTSTTIKKKGPGMPPPPMIPGKHNMELNDGWDTPKNGPLVPPSPPTIIAAPAIDLSLDKQNSNFDGEPAWPTPGQAVSQAKDQPQQNSQNHNNTNNNSQGQSQHNSNNNSGKYDNNKYDKYDKYDKYEKYENNNQRGGYHMNNNQNNNYHGRQQYNNHHQNSGPNQHHYNNSSNYNDYQKPYHQHPHQMPTAPLQKYDQAPITRSMQQPPQQQQQQQPQQNNPVPPSSASSINNAGSDYNRQRSSSSKSDDENVLDQLRVKNQYNPSELDLSLVDNARFFVIKSYSEDDIHRSIKYEIWCSTEHGNKRLDQAFREREKENGVIYLFFSVNSSGHFCGVAQMMTSVDYNSNSSVWSQDKWKGSFRVKWIYVKDVPNTQLRHIRLENNENKPVTNSRDTQEVPNSHGVQILKIVHSYKHTTSIFDDFTHYEKRQEEEDSRKNETNDGGYQKPMTLPASHHSTHNRENNQRQQQYDRSYDRDYNGGGFDRGNNFNNGNSFNKYGGSGGYNNDYKPFNNGRGNFHNKRNDFRNNDRNDRNGSDQSGGIYRSKDYQQNDDFGNRGGYRSDRGGSRGRGGFRSMNHN